MRGGSAAYDGTQSVARASRAVGPEGMMSTSWRDYADAYNAAIEAALAPYEGEPLVHAALLEDDADSLEEYAVTVRHAGLPEVASLLEARAAMLRCCDTGRSARGEALRAWRLAREGGADLLRPWWADDPGGA